MIYPSFEFLVIRYFRYLIHHGHFIHCSSHPFHPLFISSIAHIIHCSYHRLLISSIGHIIHFSSHPYTVSHPLVISPIHCISSIGHLIHWLSHLLVISPIGNLTYLSTSSIVHLIHTLYLIHWSSYQYTVSHPLVISSIVHLIHWLSQAYTL